MILQTDAIESLPAISLDGRWMAYQSSESGQMEVVVRPFPAVDGGGRWQISTNGGFDPVWARDGQALFFRDRQSLRFVEVETRSTFNHGPPSVAFPLGAYLLGGGAARAYDLAPDGRSLWRVRPESRESLMGMLVVLNWRHELLERVPVP